MIRRAAGFTLVLGLVLAGATACTPKDDGTAAAQALAAALNKHTVGSVEFNEPAATVQKDLTSMASGIDPLWPSVKLAGLEKVDDNTARAKLTYSWTLPEITKPWTYTTTADLKRDGGGWAVQWTPAMVESSLKPGETLAVTTTDAKRAEILASDGDAIVKDRPVQVVGINKQGISAAQAATSAKQLAAVLDIDPAAYAAKVKAYGPVAFVDAITLRQPAFDALDQTKLKAITGYLAVANQLPLAPTRTFASAILGTVQEATADDIKKSKGTVHVGQMVGASGLEASFNAELSGTPAVTVAAVAPAATSGATASASASAEATADAPPATRPLYSVDAVNGTNVKTTLVPKLQEAAEDALADVSSPSAIVAIRPSTGAILAAANGPDSNGYNTAFLGQYAPGSTFKIATSLGLFREGMSPTSTVSCTPTLVADGKKFQNAQSYDPAALGNITMTTAIAHSCNTAFVAEAPKLSQAKLSDAAGALGIGMTNNLGLAAFTGSVPSTDTGTNHDAAMIGQGHVEVSPLDMATLMASVVKGSAVVPQLVAGHDGAAKPAAGAKLTDKEASQLRTMMRAVVTDGYLTDLLDLPGQEVIGKTGTAEYGTKSPPQTHSWVIAGQCDVAIAVFVEDGDLGAVTGGPLAKSMLQAAEG